jgi:hypothetical protein
LNTPAPLRSNVEFAKRVFLDRLTTDAQPLLQPANIDEGPGDEYDYAGVGDSGNFGVGFDCSGLDGVVLAIAIFGPRYFAGTGYTRLFSTETFPGPLPGFRRTTQADLLAGDYPIKVCIGHYGGGPDSHMACQIDGWDMESNGDFGVCTEPPQITGIGSSYWNDWWVWDGQITEDTNWRQPMTYPRGLDYAGGDIAGADLTGAGITFVCRYVASGGTELPAKQLTAGEFTDLVNNGIGVVFNWEVDASAALNGASQGTADAQAALANVLALPGIPQGYQPVIYFSVDFDATPDNQTPINAYLQAAAAVLGGAAFVGIYGGYWPLSRALDAGVCQWAWQTEAWSGGNIDSRVNIMQRNSLGYQTIGGVQADVDEAHTANFGQFTPAAAPPPPPPPPAAPDPTMPAFLAALTDRQVMNLIAMQLLGPNGGGWDQLGTNPAAMAAIDSNVATGGPITLVDRVAWLGHHASTHPDPTP